MKLFFKIFNEWVLFLTGFFLLSGFLNNLITANIIPGYFRILFVITLVSGAISLIVWIIKFIDFINDLLGENFK